MEKESRSFVDRKLMIQRTYTAICLFFCVTIVFLYIFALIRGASLESILISGIFLLVLNISLCGLLYFLSIRVARKYTDNPPGLESQSSRQNYLQYLLLFAFLVFDISGLTMIFVKKILLLGIIFVFIGTGLLFIWYKLEKQKGNRLKAPG